MGFYQSVPWRKIHEAQKFFKLSIKKKSDLKILNNYSLSTKQNSTSNKFLFKEKCKNIKKVLLCNKLIYTHSDVTYYI